MLCWQRDKQIDLWKRTENTETDSFKYNQLRSDRGAKAKKKKRNKNSLLTNGTGTSEHPHTKSQSRYKRYTLHKN